MRSGPLSPVLGGEGWGEGRTVMRQVATLTRRPLTPIRFSQGGQYGSVKTLSPEYGRGGQKPCATMRSYTPAATAIAAGLSLCAHVEFLARQHLDGNPWVQFFYSLPVRVLQTKM